MKTPMVGSRDRDRMTTLWHRTALACLGLVLSAGTVGAQERLSHLTLDEALAVAARLNPSLVAKEREVDAVRAGEITAGLRPNPTASYLAEQFGSSSTDPQHTVTVSQTIETGGKRQRRISSARAATRVTGFELDDIRRQVAAQVKKGFVDLLVGQATLALAEQNLRTLDEVERIQRLRAEKGDISELELLRIQLQRFAFERDAADARQAERAARIALRTTMGFDLLTPDFQAEGSLEFRDVVANPSALRRATLANRGDVRAAEAAGDKARADVELARANASWDVSPQIEYQRIGRDNTIGVGVSIPLRIFDRNQGEIARTRAEAERARAQRDVVASQALSEVDTALAALGTEREKVRLLTETYLPKAQRARDTVEFAYRRGGLSLLDFLDAQRTYRETSLEQLRALGNYWSAVYQLEAASGGVLEH
jgi:outer membrane protein, heavy metal efflux system